MEKAKGIVWNLQELYTSDADPQIGADIDSAIKHGEKFNDKYYGKIADESCPLDRLLAALKDYESLLERIYRPYAMSALIFAGDGRSETYKALLARVQDAMTRIENSTLFFALEIQKISDSRIAEFYADDKLGHYKNYLESLRVFTPYMLNEREEQIINHKNLSGKTAFVNLFDEFTATFDWQLEIDGETRTLTQSEIRELARHPDADLRKRAKAAHDGKYGDNALIFTNIFGNLIKDHAVEMELRSYQSPIQPTYLRNKVPQAVVDTMMQVTAEHYPLVQRYCHLKAKLLGIPKLRGSDLYAPISKSKRVVPFEEGKALVLDSFHEFSVEFGKIIERAFSEHWIDAEIRPGKRGGAFCYGIVPSLHPYVLMNYVDDLNSVYTLAHELGHALHDVLAGEQQSLLTYHPPLVLAETASVFAEMLLTRKLLAEEKEPETRKQIIASKLEDYFGTIFRQTMYTYFELDAHLEGGKRRLSAEELCQMWLKRREALYGDSVDFLPEEKWFWAVIPHFIHTRFYCYAYTFGALLVLALFNRYEEEGQAFIPRYRQLLAAGDSNWPADLLQAMNMDMNQADFWQGGFKVVTSLLNELESLVGEA
ncbi:MAG: M3 family oligoendopeptidase [bacterium]